MSKFEHIYLETVKSWFAKLFKSSSQIDNTKDLSQSQTNSFEINTIL